MRAFLVLALLLPVAAAAGPLMPPPPAAGQAGVVPVQEKLFGRLFGRGGDKQATQQSDETLRIQQLEDQVRQLTGQVETLTYTVRRLEGALAQPGQRSDAGAAIPAGPGAPPAPLGQTVASGAAPAAADLSPRGPGGFDASTSRPIDLSGLGVAAAAAPPAQAVATAAPGPRNAALAEVRELHDSGRYAMAADRARQIIAGGASGAVASEARYMLGEALLAQRDFRGAANSFLENYTADPQGAKAPMSLVRLGTALNGLGETKAACSSLAELFDAYPSLDATVRAEAQREREAAHCA